MATTQEQILWNYLRARLPRIITQLSRDPDAPTYGSWDRNFWHYKMRDFSSMILQQGMLVIDAMENYNGENNLFYKNPVAPQWIDASLDFWADQQLKNGSFNEYYPYESGFPPTAFSLYAAGGILKNRNYLSPGEKVTKAVQKAINWLLKHPEKEALNQEAAGLAGIVLCSKLPGVLIDTKLLDERLDWFFKSQSAEGWFPEYDGPDTGYLAVTIDCLWEIYEATKDERAFSAMGKAIGYISTMISASYEMPVMINSRNTDYLVIYGMTRMAAAGNETAAAIVNRVIGRLSSPDHFLNRTDDRYSVHYVYASFFRSLHYLGALTEKDFKLPCETAYQNYYPGAGILVRHNSGQSSVYVNLRKGGVVNAFTSSGIAAADFGFRIKVSEKKVAVSHFQHPSYIISQDNDYSYSVTGKMTLHGWMVPSPLKHVVLRGISFTLGNRLIPLLKKIMIFNKKETGWTFRRDIQLEDKKLNIRDIISGNLPGKAGIYRAPHYSLRHVSSAGQFMSEEMLPVMQDKGKIENNSLVFDREIDID
jgi:hypothetical protein